jgi:glutamine amidotransferase
MIGIIDYKAGNGPSVLNALNYINVPGKLISHKDEIKTVNAIILPGVGAAKATMESLRQMELIEELEEFVLVKGKPFLGICVGLQVLFDYSEEENTDCLGWISGNIVKYLKDKVRVPQMGWNKVTYTLDNPILKDLGESGYYYFVNSYYPVPKLNEIILGKADYGGQFCAMIAQKNIYATQCHIEKSGQQGLDFLNNFAKLIGG